jgi:predicted HTH domain antitoxin
MPDGVVVKSRFPSPLLKAVDSAAEKFGISRAQAIKFLTLLGIRLYNIGLTERALKLYEDGKVPVNKAAELAGLPVDSFIYVASSRGMKTTVRESIKGIIDALNPQRKSS